MRALDDRWVQSALRRKALLTAGLTLLGVSMIGGSAAIADHYAKQSQELRTHGGQVAGVVSTLRADRKGSEGAAWIHYIVADREYDEVVDLGADTDKYHKGQTVTVYYDRRQPRTMTIDAEENQPPSTVLPMISLLIAGLAAVFAGASGCLMWVRRWPLLMQPWVDVSVRVQREGSGRSVTWVLRRPRHGLPIRLYSRLGHDGDHVPVQLIERGELAIVGVSEHRLRAGQVRARPERSRKRWFNR